MKKNFTIKEIKKTNLEDTFLGTYFYRKTSTYFTYFLAKTNLTPNNVSVLSLVLGLFSGFLFSFPGTFINLIAFVILQISMVFDYCDGQIARLKKLGSKRGAWLDVVSGMVQNNLIVLGLIIGGFRVTNDYSTLILGFITLFAWNMTCYVHLNAMIFFPNVELKKTKMGDGIKKGLRIKPQYLSIGSDVYFIVLGVSAVLSQINFGFLVMSLLGNLYWLATAYYFFTISKNAR